MTDLVDICVQYEDAWDRTRRGFWYDPKTGLGDYLYSVGFHIEWARQSIEQKRQLNRNLKEVIG